jgi:hypothetical protein
VNGKDGSVDQKKDLKIGSNGNAENLKENLTKKEKNASRRNQLKRNRKNDLFF